MDTFNENVVRRHAKVPAGAVFARLDRHRVVPAVQHVEVADHHVRAGIRVNSIRVGGVRRGGICHILEKQVITSVRVHRPKRRVLHGDSHHGEILAVHRLNEARSAECEAVHMPPGRALTVDQTFSADAAVLDAHTADKCSQSVVRLL